MDNETAKMLAKTIVKGLVAKHNLKATNEMQERITAEQREGIRELVQKLQKDVEEVM